VIRWGRLAACLEGRDDDVTHRSLDQRLEVRSVEAYGAAVDLGIARVVGRAKAELRLPTGAEMATLDALQEALVAALHVLAELGNPAVMEKSTRVGVVEIAWRGKVDRTCFPLPLEVAYLSVSTKAAFLAAVDLSTTEKRMTAVVNSVDLFLLEMELIYSRAEQSPLYREVHHHLSSVKLANYGLILAINLNIFLSPRSLQCPSASAYARLMGTDHLTHAEALR
jgi:hypothetical protein